MALVESIDEIPEFMTWLTAACQGGILAIDTETCDLDWTQQRFTRLVQFGDRTSGWAVPIEWWPRLVHQAMALVRDSGATVVMHNAKFDMHALEDDGYPVPHWENVEDTMVLHHLVSPHHSHALKTIGVRELGEWAGMGQWALKEVFKRTGTNWSTIPADNYWYWSYAVMDTILTLHVWDKLQACDFSRDAYEREMAYVSIMYRSEARGMRVDPVAATKLRSEWEEELHNQALELKAAGIKNPNSNQQIEAVLRGLGWDPEEFTDTGQAQLDKIVKAELATYPGAIGRLASELIDYQRKSKWTSTYIDTFLSKRDSNDRVHPSIKTLGAKTGRSSITGPPLQTLPSRGPMAHFIKDLVLPFGGDEVLYSIDYSGQEYRILACFAEDEAWLHEFRHGAGDPHTMVADMLGITREQAKTFNFAMVYGAGPAKLALGTGLSVNQVENFLSIYANRFPAIARFIQETQRQGYLHLRNGEEAHCTTIGGRRAYADDDQLYALTNYKIQGSGSDVLKQAVIRLDKVGLADHIIIPVHDELLYSFPRAQAAEMARVCADVMEERDWFQLPIVAEAEGPYERWGSKYNKEHA